MPGPRELVGEHFGDLTVISRAENRRLPGGKMRRRWTCRCVCGREITTDGLSLTTGHTKSCGCIKQRKHWNTRHGHNRNKPSPTLLSWRSMLTRSYRGVFVGHDPRWDRFEAFLEDMGERPPGTTLDRMRGSGIYEKSNCRWASRKKQTENRRNTRWLTIGGETKTLAAWADQAGITYGALNSRVIAGWDPDRLLAPMQTLVREVKSMDVGPEPHAALADNVVAAFADELAPDLQRRLATAIRQAIERAYPGDRS